MVNSPYPTPILTRIPPHQIQAFLILYLIKNSPARILEEVLVTFRLSHIGSNQ